MVQLPVNIDASYADTGDASVKIHQQHHDAVHGHNNALPTPTGYTATVGTVLDDCEDTVGWTQVGGGDLATDSTNFVVGTKSVTGSMNVASSTPKLYVDLPSNVAVGSFDRVVLWLRWQGLNGFNTSTISGFFRVKVASAVGFGGTVAAAAVPGVAALGFVRVVVDISGLSQVRSVGVQNDVGGIQGGGASVQVWLDDIRFANLTEADQALGDAGAVVFPAGYVPGVAQDVRPADETTTTLDLRPTRVLLSRHGGRRHLREWEVPEDGLTECSTLLGAAMNGIGDGDLLESAPDATYWCDRPIILTGRNVTYDFNGATLLTRAWRGGDNNVLDPIFNIQGDGITIRNARIFGYRERVTNGSALVDVTGSVVSGTTRLLDTSGDTVRQALTVNALVPHYARYPLIMFPSATRTLATAADPAFSFGNVFLVRLSDSAQIASDCVIELVWDLDSTVVLASRTLTLTAAPTDYVITYEPADLRRVFHVRVRKATVTANTITVHSMTEYGYTDYSSTHDSANVIITNAATDVLLENLHIEGAATDAIDVTHVDNYRVTVRGLFSRCSNRQGISFNRGTGYVLDGFQIYSAGRSGIDVEPYATDWLVDGMTIRNGRIYNCLNYAFAMANWAGIRDLHIENVEGEGFRAGGLVGGARGGLVKGVKLATVSKFYGATTGDVFEINGQNMEVSGISADGDVHVGAGTGTYDDGSGNVVYYPSGNRVDGVVLTRGTAYQGTVGWDNVIAGVAGPTGTSYPSTAAITDTTWPRQIASTATDVEPASVFHATHPGPISTKTPHVVGGPRLWGYPLSAVRGIGGSTATAAVLAPANRTTSGTSGAIDLGGRGRVVRVRAGATAVTGTLLLTVEVSQDNTNWYTVGTLPLLTASRFHADVELVGCERYLRVAYTLAGTTPAANFRVDATSLTAGANTAGIGQAVTQSATSATVTFPGTGEGPAFSTVALVGITGGSLTPSTTYFYRVGARSRRSGPAAWLTEQSVALGSNTAVRLTISRWHFSQLGWMSEGFTVLRGTSTGVYTVRYDVLPKPGVVGLNVRNDFSQWSDLGTSITGASPFDTAFPTTYQTPSPLLTVGDETGLEPDTAYGVQVNPSWLTTVAVTAKRRDGFDLSFGTAAPAGASVDWFIVR